MVTKVDQDVVSSSGESQSTLSEAKGKQENTSLLTEYVKYIKEKEARENGISTGVSSSEIQTQPTDQNVSQQKQIAAQNHINLLNGEFISLYVSLLFLNF